MAFPARGPTMRAPTRMHPVESRASIRPPIHLSNTKAEPKLSPNQPHQNTTSRSQNIPHAGPCPPSTSWATRPPPCLRKYQHPNHDTTTQSNPHNRAGMRNINHSCDAGVPRPRLDRRRIEQPEQAHPNESAAVSTPQKCRGLNVDLSVLQGIRQFRRRKPSAESPLPPCPA